MKKSSFTKDTFDVSSNGDMNTFELQSASTLGRSPRDIDRKGHGIPKRGGSKGDIDISVSKHTVTDLTASNGSFYV